MLHRILRSNFVCCYQNIYIKGKPRSDLEEKSSLQCRQALTLWGRREKCIIPYSERGEQSHPAQQSAWLKQEQLPFFFFFFCILSAASSSSLLPIQGISFLHYHAWLCTLLPNFFSSLGRDFKHSKLIPVHP